MSIVKDMRKHEAYMKFKGIKKPKKQNSKLHYYEMEGLLIGEDGAVFHTMNSWKEFEYITEGSETVHLWVAIHPYKIGLVFGNYFRKRALDLFYFEELI